MPTEEVQVPTHTRDELPPVLATLQWIFCTPQINQEIFALLEQAISKNKKATGRPGMDLWHVLVLAVVRLTLDCDYDRLAHVANYERLVRQIMGISTWLDNPGQIQFHAKTICDNTKLLSDTLLAQMNQVVIQHGHHLVKKKEDEKLAVKSDTYVLATNVHFPTDC